MYDDYEDEYDNEPKKEKEIIEGYTVQASVNIGNKRIIYAMTAQCFPLKCPMKYSLKDCAKIRLMTI